MTEKWVKHIRHTLVGHEGKSLCDVDLSAEFAFVGIDHAFNEHARDGLLIACPVCLAVVVETFYPPANPPTQKEKKDD